MNSPIAHPSEIARLESISRHRALTIAESLYLEELIYRGRGKRPKPPVPDKPSHTRRFDATLDAWKINAEIANEAFVEALTGYFKRGGRA